MIRLLLVAAVASALKIHPGQEYTYQYETQITTGVPLESKIFSGLKLKTTVIFQTLTSSSMAMKFENPTLLSLNGEVSSADPTNEQLPEDLFRPLSGEESRLLQEFLSKPVKFTYIRGSFSNVQTESDDPEWSVNIKRGLLSLGVINFEERRSLDPVSRMLNTGRLPQDQTEIYAVMEPSIGGECETVYNVRPLLDSSSGEPRMFVTKTRNYMKCLNRASITNNIYHGHTCAECEKDRTEPVKSGSQIHYVILGNKREYLVESIIAESQHIFTPYSERGGNVATFINQTLVLTGVKDQQERISLRSPKRQPSDLLAQLPGQKKLWQQQQQESSEEQDSSSQEQQQSRRQRDRQQSRDQQQSPQQRRRQQRRQQRQQQQDQQQSQEQQQRSMQKIDKLLQTLSTFTDVTIQEEAGPFVLTLLEEYQKADDQVMRQLFQKYCSERNPSNPQTRRIRKIFLDMMPFIGTYVSGDILSEAISNNKITPEEAMSFFSILTFTSKPDIRLAQKLLELTNSPFIRQNSYVKQGLWLSIGALGDLLANHHENSKSSLQKKLELVKKVLQRESRRQVRQQLESHKQKMEDKLEQSSTLSSQIRHEIVRKVNELIRSESMEDKMLAFKAMGNAGFEEFLPEVSRTLQDSSQPVAFRRMAVWSLGKTAKRSPIAVRDVLLPRFFDPNEDEDVRIGAYYMSVLSNPPRPVLQQIVQSLRFERNPHVGTFVYTHVKYLSQSDNPCLMNMTKMASFALRFGRRFHPKYQFSRYLQYTSYNDQLKAGGTFRAGIISSPGEFIPRAAYMALDAQVFGYSMTPIEVGYNLEGVQELLSKILGPGGSVSRSRSVVDILKQRSQSPSSQEQRQQHQQSRQQQQQPQEQLRVSPRQSPEPSGHVYYKLFGNEIRYVNIDREFVSQLLLSGELSVPSTEEGLQVGQPISLYKTYIMGNTENVLATEVGLPIHLKLRSSSMFKVEGRMSISGLPSLFRSNRPGQDPNEITGRLTIQPSTVFNIRGTMEIDANFLRSGAAINAVMHAEAPLTVTVASNPMTNKYNTKVDVSQLKEKIMKMEITPQTFIQLEPNDLRQWPSQPETKDIDFMNGARVSSFSTDFGQDRLGLKFSLKGQTVSRNFNPNVPFYPFNGKQQLYFTVTPGPNPPSMLEMEFKYLHSPEPSRSQRESSQRGSSEESDDSSPDWSFWSSLSSLVSGSPDQQQQQSQQRQQQQQRQQRQQQSQEQQEQRSQPQQSEERLPQRSLRRESMSSLKQKVQEIAPLYSEGYKHGFVVLMTTLSSNSQPIRQAKVYVLYQRMPDGLTQQMTLRTVCSHIPNGQGPPLTVDVDMSFKFPRALVDPSQLLDPEYQQEIQRQIRVLTQQDSQKDIKKSLKDIVSSQVSREMQKLQSLSNVQDVIDQQVNDVIEESRSSSNSEKQDLMKLVKQQKQQSKEAEQLRQQSYDSRNKQEKVKKLEELVRKCSDSQSKIQQKLQSASQQPSYKFKKVLLKYIVMKQSDIHQKLKQISKSLQHHIPSEKRQELGQMLSQQKALLKDSKVKQVQLLSSSSDPDSSEQPSPSPSSASCLQSIKQKIDEQNRVIARLSSPSQQSVQSLQSVQSSVQRVLDTYRSSDSQAPCRSALLEQPPPYSSVIKRKLLEQLIQNEQIIQSLKQVVKDKKEESSQRTPQEQEALEKIKKQIEALKETSKVMSKSSSNLQSQNLDALSVPKIPASERSAYSQLQKIETKQMKALLKLQQPKQYVDSDMQQKKRSLQSSLRDAESVQEELSRIVQSKASELRSSKSIRKLVQVAEKQKKLMESVSKSAKKLYAESVSKEQRSDQELQQSKEKAENLLLLQMSIVHKIKESLSKQDALQSLREPQSSPSDRQLIKEMKRKMSEIEQNVYSMKRSSIPTFLQEKAQSELSSTSMISKQLKSVQDKQISSPDTDRSDAKSLQKAIRKLVKIVDDIEKLVSSRSSSLDSPVMLKQQISKQKQILVSLSRKQQQLVSDSQQRQSSSSERSEQQSSQEQRQWSSQPEQSSQERGRESLPRDQQRQSSQQRRSSQEQSSSERQSSSEQSREDQQDSSSRHSSSQLSGPFEMTVKILYGDQNSERKQINIKVVGRKSLQQLMCEQKESSPLERSKLVKDYLRDKHQGDERVKKSYKKLKEQLNTLGHFHMDIQYNKNELPPNVRKFFWNIQDFMKAFWYLQTSTEFPGPNVNDGNIQIVFNMENNNQQVDVVLHTPYETDRFSSIMLPQMGSWYFSSLQSSLRSSRYHKKPSSYSVIPKQPSGVCQLKGRTVVTLDQKEYQSPDTQGCDAVLVMDCSSASKFAVKVKSKPSDQSKKILKVHVSGKEVEVDPSSPTASIKVDNQLQSLQDGEMKQIPQQQQPSSQRSSSQQKPILEISKKGKIVTIKAKQQDVEVKSDGEMVSVKVSPYYYSKVCGMCGNFDGKKNNEYEGPQKEQHKSQKSFVYKYLQPNEQCSSDKIQQIKSSSQQSSPSSPECQPLKRTVVRHDESQNKVCFSTQPVKQCKQGCRPSSSQPKSVQMTCIDNSSRAQQLQRQSSQRPLTELQDKRVDKSVTVSEPVRCVRS